MDFMDYAPSASGMVYANNLNPPGVTVDGNADSIAAGRLDWEILTGNQGTVAQAHRFILEQPGLQPGSYYADEADPAVDPCAGDSSEYGASGHRFDQTIRNTDPALEQQAGELYRFELIRTLAYGPPNQPNSFAMELAGELSAPLVVAVDEALVCPDGDGDGYAICNGGCDLPPATVCGDCDDGNGSIHPGVGEQCGNGVDDDCDGMVDAADPDCPAAQDCPDADGDMYAICDGGCELSPGTECGDCDDGDGGVRPGAVEFCNGLDDDCNAVSDDPLCTSYDINGDRRIDAGELSWLGRAFGLCSAEPAAAWWRPVDYDGSGCVDGDDLVVLSNHWGLDCSGELLACP